MASKNIDYDGMAKYFLKSSRTLRRMESEKPNKFKILYEEYSSSLAVDKNNNVIVVAGLKGGVGKSTISDMICSYLGESVIFNIDLTQESVSINSCDTVEYADYIGEKTITEIIDDLKAKYDFVIIDTAPDITEDTREAVSATKNIVLPMTLGKRSRLAMMTLLESYFGNESEDDIDGEYKLYFVFNNYVDDKKRQLASDKFKESFQKFIPKPGIKFKSGISSLKTSGAVNTSEETGKSFFELQKENSSAYGHILKRITYLCDRIENHFDLQ